MVEFNRHSLRDGPHRFQNDIVNTDFGVVVVVVVDLSGELE